jgi:hypothetical protein
VLRATLLVENSMRRKVITKHSSSVYIKALLIKNERGIQRQMKRLLIVVLFFGTALGQRSKTSPGYSLARLDAQQCSYAVAVINQVTKNIEAMSNDTLTEESARFPRPPQTVDAYVKAHVELLIATPIEFAGAKLKAIANRSSNAVESTKINITLQQREFAYVLELRGCALEPNSVKFVPVVLSSQKPAGP